MEMQKFSTKKPYILILLAVLATFLISANSAWLNPRPDYAVTKYPAIPFLWQYNIDSAVELFSGAYFPEYFRTTPTRINRPGFPIIVHLMAESLNILLKPFVSMGIIKYAAASYALMKLGIYFLAGACFYQLLLPYTGFVAALIAPILLVTHYFAVQTMTTFVMTDMQILTPIFVVFFFSKLCDTYTPIKNILYSMIVGYLVLVKENIAIYCSVLLFALYFRKYKEVVLSLASSFVPYLLWRLYLHLHDITYHNDEESTYKMGIPYLLELLTYHPLLLIQTVVVSLKSFAESCLLFHGLPFLVAIAYVKELLYVPKKNNLMIFFSLCIFMTWVQHFMARKLVVASMSGDFYFIPLAMFSSVLAGLVCRQKRFNPTSLLIIFVFLWLCESILTQVHFPWVSPNDQKSAAFSEKYLKAQ